MYRAVQNGFAQWHPARRRFGRNRVLALALASVSFAVLDRAEAACVPVAGGIDCTGTGNPGIGTAADTGLNYHIFPGATITAGAASGVTFKDGNVVVDTGGAITSTIGTGIFSAAAPAAGVTSTVTSAGHHFGVQRYSCRR